jgi:PAS domain S-box-containing protein
VSAADAKKEPPVSPSVGREGWRSDLLRVVLRVTLVLGSIVYLPSAYVALREGKNGVVVLDTVALVLVAALVTAPWFSRRSRSAGLCGVFYLLGVGLLLQVGAISQVFLVGFSLFVTLLLGRRWGLRAVALSALTLLVAGYLGIAHPEMVLPGWKTETLVSWAIITANFTLVDVSIVLALGTVIAALEKALRRAVSANADLEQSRALLDIAGQTARLGGWRLDVNGEHVEWSDECCELHEMPLGTRPTFGEALGFMVEDFRAEVRTATELCATQGVPFDKEGAIVTAQGNPMWIRLIGRPSRNGRGKVTHVLGSMQDINDRKLAEERHEKLEDQLRQAQRMETVGLLAGGVAHDFNNLLSVVLSYSELLSEDLPEGDPMRADLEEIGGAGRRALDLTRQLLAFSRRQVLAPRLTDLGLVVNGMQGMLRRLIGEDVELSTSCAPELLPVLVDPGQVEQVIMNLAVNARDAMPRGGLLTIETAEVVLDAAYAAEHVGVTPGPHVMLAVSDNGSGMDKATQARMFEPFFTTKEQGKGTGLGLATVFGVVQQSGGSIWVYSEPGKGTTFKVYFPIAAQSATASLRVTTPVERGAPRGVETILLVEDEEGVRVLARTILRRLGYTVLEAPNGVEALALAEAHPGTIDLLLTDVVMPRMSGRELVEQLLPMRPSLKVLFMSGYTDDAVVRHGILDASIAFLQKPITPEPLARKVREVLNGSAMSELTKGAPALS